MPDPETNIWLTISCGATMLAVFVVSSLVDRLFKGGGHWDLKIFGSILFAGAVAYILLSIGLATGWLNAHHYDEYGCTIYGMVLYPCELGYPSPDYGRPIPATSTKGIPQ